MENKIGQLLKSTIIYGAGGFLNRLISFLLLPLFTAYLTPVDYGISSMLLLVSSFASPILSLGLGVSTGICYFENNDNDRKSAVIWTSFIIMLISSLIFLIPGIWLSGKISFILFKSTDYSYLVFIALIYTGFSILVQPFMWRLQFENRAKKFVVLTTTATIISICASIIMVIFLKQGVKGLIESWLIGQTVTFLIFILFAAGSLRLRLNSILVKELLRLGIPMIPSFACLFLLSQGNRFILQWLKGLEFVGIYTVGFNLGMLMNIIVGGFTTAWMPYFLSYKDKPEEAKVLFSKILTYYVFLFGSISLLFYALAKPVVIIMTQPAFYEAYKSIGPSATAQFLTGVFSILLPGVYYAKEVKIITLIQIVTVAITSILSLIFIYYRGLEGTIVSLVFGYLILILLQYIWNIRRKGTYQNVNYEWKKLILFVFFYIGFSIFTYLDKTSSLWAELILNSIMFFILICVVYKLLEFKERQFLLDFGKSILMKVK
ncbi:MAG: oligosaccharide flippase family protein [Candidatus Brocadiia bacterium]